jgi:hypothetical protein
VPAFFDFGFKNKTFGLPADPSEIARLPKKPSDPRMVRMLPVTGQCQSSTSPTSIAR